MPSAYVQIACDTTLPRLHDGLVRQRSAVAASSKTSESACRYVRLQSRENAASNSIVITRAAQTFSDETGISLTPAAVLAPTTAAAARLRKKAGGRQKIMSADEVSAMFADDEQTEAKYYFIVIPTGPQLEALLPNAETYFTDLFEAWADRPNALAAQCSLEVCLVGPPRGASEEGRAGVPSSSRAAAPFLTRDDGPAAQLSLGLMFALQAAKDRAALRLYEHEMGISMGSPPAGTVPIDSVCVTTFDTEREVCDRVLHIALYFSQCKDAKVRAEVAQHAKHKVDDMDARRLYATCLCEIPNVSERRASVIMAQFPTLAGLLRAIRRDDGSFEQRLAVATEYGESRVAGHGLAANVRAAMTTEYVPDAADPHMARLRRMVHEMMGITPEQQYPYLKAKYGGGGGGEQPHSTGGAGSTADPSAAAPAIAAGTNLTPISQLGSSAKKKPRPSAVVLLSSSSSSDDDGNGEGDGEGSTNSNAARSNTATAAAVAAVAGRKRGRGDEEGRVAHYSDEVRGSGPLFANFQLSQQLREEDARRPRAHRQQQQQQQQNEQRAAAADPLDDLFGGFGLDSLLGLGNSNSRGLP